jgi:beta-lactamase class A
VLLIVSLVACGSDVPVDGAFVSATEPTTTLEEQTVSAPTSASMATVVAQSAGAAPQEVVNVETPAFAATATATATETATSTVTLATPEPGLEPVYDMRAIQATIDDIMAGVDGTVAVAIAAGDGTILFELNGAESMEAASLYKLPIMVELYRRFDSGELSADDSVLISASYFAEGADSIGFEAIDAYVGIDTLLFAMISQSSNVAAYALLDLVGNDSVNATMADLGLDGIEVRWSPRFIPPAEVFPEFVEPVDEVVDEDSDPPEPDDGEQVEEEPVEEEPVEEDHEPDEEDDPAGKNDATATWLSVNRPNVAATIRADEAFNVVQATDLARLLAMLVNGEVVSSDASAAMVDLLASQQIPGGLSGYLPAGAVAHKTGYLEDGVINDAGIIMTASGPFIAVVLTEGVRDDIAYQLMSEVGLLVLELGSD